MMFPINFALFVILIFFFIFWIFITLKAYGLSLTCLIC